MSRAGWDNLEETAIMIEGQPRTTEILPRLLKFNHLPLNVSLESL